MRALRAAVPTILPPLLLALASAGAARATGEIVLPTPAGPSGVEPVALRLSVTPDPRAADPAVHEAHLVMTLLGPSESGETLRLRFPAEAASTLRVTRLGSPVSVAVPEDGTAPEAAVRLGADEAAVVEARWRVTAETLPGLPPAEAGWWGRTRGPLLQPLHRFRIGHPDGSPLAAGGLEVVVEPRGRPLASGVVADTGARISEGRVAWALPAAAPGERLAIAWPALETEAVLPRSAEEARGFLADWSGERTIAPDEVALVRAGLLAVHELPFRRALTSGDDARLLSRDRRPGWATAPTVMSEAEQAAMQVLTAFEDELRADDAPRVARVRPPGGDRPGASVPSIATTAEPAAEPPSHIPAATPAPAPDRIARREPAPPPKAAASAPSAPSVQTADRRAEPPAAPRAPLGTVDSAPLVTIPPDRSWREERVFDTTASIPDDLRSARRAIERVERSGGGVSRAVLQREAVAARHGKQWAPGYVADFFSRKPWYRPDPDFTLDRLSTDELAAWQLLDDWIESLRGMTDEAPQVATRSERPERQRPDVAMPPAGPTGPRDAGDSMGSRAAAAPTAMEPEATPAPDEAAPPRPRPERPAPAAAEPAPRRLERPWATGRPAPSDTERPRPGDTERPPWRADRSLPPPVGDETVSAPAVRAGDAPIHGDAGAPPVPWIRDGRGARLFLVQERSRGLDAGRIHLAIATIEARHGRPFTGEPDWRRRFEGRSWYSPEPGWTPTRLPTDAREAIQLLRRSL